MTHTRIRPFNTGITYPEQRLDNDLAQAVVARGATIFLRGQCPQDLDTAEDVGPADPVAQTHRVMQNIRQLIEEAGGEMAHLCKLVVYLTDIRHREAVYRTMGEYIRGIHPVCTGLVVVALARPGWLAGRDRSDGGHSGMTFSIAARCARTGQLGMAISSSSPAVAARCAHVRAGVGAVCSQNVTDPRLGPAALDLMAAGATSQTALDALADRPHIAFRQLTAVDAAGRAAHYSGAALLGTHAAIAGESCVGAGNMLATPDVPAAMIAAFARADGELGARLLAALQAGLEGGGEAGPVRSAGLLIAGDAPFPLTDLRVDWDDDPVARLADLWTLWSPQADAYRTRALDPTAAPSYGVPGDP